MAHVVSGIKVLCVSLLIVAVACTPVACTKVFDVRSYGARGDGRADNADAFLKAWKDACAWKGSSRVYVPAGTFYLRDVNFAGPCKSPITFYIKGTLLSPKNPDHIKRDTWINFQYIDNLSIVGGGTLDGQGSHSWPLNDCRKNPRCRRLPMTLGFQFVRHSTVKGIKSLNSKADHIKLFSVDDFNITGVTVTAPGDSPNTDGIKIGSSSHVNIAHSKIGTGDDCISILSGTTKVQISDLNCGPGHGISIGSLGRSKKERDIRGLMVKDSIFKGTTDGLRIKTWESSVAKISVADIVYENIQMINVGYPINIDQYYCPHPPCRFPKEPSHVQIQNVRFNKIWGTSTKREAVKIKCSAKFPCRDMKLHNIHLVHRGRDGKARAIMENVKGTVGNTIPYIRI